MCAAGVDDAQLHQRRHQQRHHDDVGRRRRHAHAEHDAGAIAVRISASSSMSCEMPTTHCVKVMPRPVRMTMPMMMPARRRPAATGSVLRAPSISASKRWAASSIVQQDDLVAHRPQPERDQRREQHRLDQRVAARRPTVSTSASRAEPMAARSASAGRRAITGPNHATGKHSSVPVSAASGAL